MDKKKRLIQLTEGILLCCVIVVMTLLCIGSIEKDNHKDENEVKTISELLRKVG